MFKFEGKIRYSETDEKGCLTVPRLIDYFQDCSSFQSESVGLSREYFEERHIAWVLSFWQVVIKRRPKHTERVSIGTFPYEFKSFMGMRNFFMEDEAGGMVACANSIWSLLDMQSGRPVKPSEEILKYYPLEERLPMEYADRKVRIPEGGNTLEPFRVKREDLDSNYHMNNARYIAAAMNYIPGNLEVIEFRAEYKKQAYLGDCIYPYIVSIEGGLAISLRDAEGAAYVNMYVFTTPGGEV